MIPDYFTDIAIAEKISEGQMSSVYMAKKGDLSVILKVLLNPYPSVEEVQEFQREYNTLQSIHSDNVIRALDLLEEGNRYGMLIEDINGIPLNKFKIPDLKSFFTIALQIVEGLGSIHEGKIIHLDINPGNVIINTETLDIRIIDFSISSHLNQERALVQSPGKLKGTVVYLSPEQTGRTNRNIDYRSDYYSLGATFYEMLIGEPPFVSSDPLELLHAHIAKKPVPPHVVKGDVPEMLSELVMKLMEKNAESRYQSASGILYDLQKCWDLLDENGKIPLFTLAEEDVSDRFKIPEKLYGREKDKKVLMDIFGEVCEQGHTQLLMVSGFSGIGKSALINEIQKPLAKERGYFVSGKFDQLKFNIPYSAILQALKDMVMQILSETEEKIDYWKQKLQEVLGQNGQLMIDLIPEVEYIIGKQQPLVELDPEKAQNRFNYVIENFLNVFSKKDTPVVLFLDDLQWADPSSLKLLEKQMLKSDGKYQFVIGAYRDNEVDVTHPLTHTLKKIEEKREIQSIKLQNLSLVDVEYLIDDTLLKTGNTELAKIVLGKTKGNPFAVKFFLKTLYEEQKVTFDFGLKHWVYDLVDVAGLKVPEQIVDLLIYRIRQLSDDIQNILQLAACVGNKFDLKILAIISQKDHIELESMLTKTVAEELLIKVGNHYKFQHDRIQQAAYSLMSEDLKKEVHVTVGRLLLNNLKKEELEDKIFDVVNHFNPGIDLIVKEEEKFRIAQLNLRAGVKAKDSTAYKAGLDYSSLCVRLMGESAWDKHFKIMYEALSCAGECAFLTGEKEKANEYYQEVLEHTRTTSEKIVIYNKQIALQTVLGNNEEAVAIGWEVLNLLGVIKLNFKDSKRWLNFKTLKEIFLLRKLLRGRSLPDVLNDKELTDMNIETSMQVLNNMIRPIFERYPRWIPLVTIKLTNLTLKHGISNFSAFGLASVGGMCILAFNKHKLGWQFGLLAQDVVKKYNDQYSKCFVWYITSEWVELYHKEYKNVLETKLEGYKTGLLTGDFQYAAYNLGTYFHTLYGTGVALNKWLEEYEKYSLPTDEPAPTMGFKGFHVMLSNLVSESDDFCEHFVEGQEKLLNAVQPHTPIIWFFNDFYAECFWFFAGDYKKALEYTLKANRNLKSVLGFIVHPEHYFIQTLILAKAVEEGESIKKYLKYFKRNLSHLKNLADNFPPNYKAKYLLMKAVYDQARKKRRGLSEQFEEAVKSAERSGITHVIGLAHESALRHFLLVYKDNIAAMHLVKCKVAYDKWGAKAVVKRMEAEYATLIDNLNVTEFKPEPTNNPYRTIHTKEVFTYDLDSVMKASQAIYEEIKLEPLLKNLMHVVIENAGAEKGVLLLDDKKGNLFIETVYNVSKDEIKLLQHEPYEKSQELSPAVVRYVAHKKDTIIYGNAVEDADIKDAYITKNKIASIVCIPLIRRGEVLGVIYLENNISTNAFTKERTEVLKMLSGQIAIAVDNALVYENLEEKVRERTLELSEKNEEITASIVYAQTIQNALLPVLEEIKPKLPEMFVYFQPKDIISGDFYFAKYIPEFNDVVLAIADCTGHGVPGAMMSVLGISTLQQIINDNKGIGPSKILEKLNYEIQRKLVKSAEKSVRDGMDIAIMRVNCESFKVKLSAAHHRITFVKASGQVEEIKGCNHFIGDDFAEGFAFKETLIQMTKGDEIFMYSDGTFDQKGGDRGKRLYYAGLEKWLTEVHALAPDQQKIVMEKKFKNWMGDEEQIDDMLLFGWKLK